MRPPWRPGSSRGAAALLLHVGVDAALGEVELHVQKHIPVPCEEAILKTVLAAHHLRAGDTPPGGRPSHAARTSVAERQRSDARERRIRYNGIALVFPRVAKYVDIDYSD